MIIDAHQHFWKYNSEKHSWINDEMAILKRDFLPHHLKEEFEANIIDGCIAVQADQSEQETKFLLQLAQENEFIKGVVGWIDLRSEHVEERLDYFNTFSKLVGFRHVVQDEPDANFMLKEDFKSGIGALATYGYTYDILIFPTQMKAAKQLVECFPEQQFVVDHLAKPYIKKGIVEPWKSQIRSIAQNDNVYCKISGMITEANWNNWEYDQLMPYLEGIFEAFGANRIMFGSDWPVCLLAGKYTEVKSIVERYITALSEGEKQQIWGENALSFYGLT